MTGASGHTILAKEPNNIKLLRNLAELYTQKKNFDRALEYYEKIRHTEGGTGEAAKESSKEGSSEVGAAGGAAAEKEKEKEKAPSSETGSKGGSESAGSSPTGGASAP